MNNYFERWKLTIVLQSFLITGLYSFIPVWTAYRYEWNNIWIFLFVPLAMFIITPMWLRLKKKISNHKILKYNSIGLTIFLTLLMAVSFWTNQNSIYLYAILLFITGSFAAGLVPITFEILRSYVKDKNIKFDPYRIFVLSSAIIVIIPFLILYFYRNNQNHLNTSLTIFFGLIGLLNCLSIWSNKNIMNEEITFKNVNNVNFKLAFQNRSFLKYFINYSLGFAINEFLGYSLFLLALLEERKYFLILVGILYLGRKLGQIFATLLQIKHKNMFGNILMQFSLLLVLISIILSKYNDTEVASVYYWIILGISQFMINFALQLKNEDEKKYLKGILPPELFQTSLIINHIFAKAVIPLLLAACCLPVIIAFDNNIVVWIIIIAAMNVAFVISLLFTISNTASKLKQE